jgi:hypothetical protein
MHIQKVQGLTIAMVEVAQRAAAPVFLTNMSKPDRPKEFYIRRTSSAFKLATDYEIGVYVKEKWGTEA